MDNKKLTEEMIDWDEVANIIRQGASRKRVVMLHNISGNSPSFIIMDNPVCEICGQPLRYSNKKFRTGYTSFQHNEDGIKIITCDDCLNFASVIDCIYRAKEKYNDSHTKIQ